MKVVSAHADVTPRNPSPLAGFGSRQGNWQRVDDPLEINALRLTDGSDEDLILVTLDGLSFSVELEEHCKATVPKGRRATVIGVASHTHFAPPIDHHLPHLGTLADDYRKLVFTKASSVIEKLYSQEPETATWSIGSSTTDGHTISRRRESWMPNRGLPPIRKRMARLPNLNGPNDETLTVIILSHDGRPSAVLWNYTCHPVCYFIEDHVSADYPGVVRATLRKHFGDIPCLFLPGFAGDIRPRILAEGGGLKHLLRRAVQGDYFGRANADRWKSWTEGIASAATAASSNAVEWDSNGHIHTTQITIPFDSIQTSPAAGRPPPHYTEVKIGDGLEFRFLSGEPVLQIRDVIQSARPERSKTIYVGYQGHLFGYLPTSKMVEEGGYEAGEFRPSFGLEGEYYRDIDRRISYLLATS